jgi:hypothetical protein
VIIDGASEMTGFLNVDHADFAINALIVTSRQRPAIQPTLVLQPQRIDSNHLLPFLNAYLTSSGISIDDAALFGATAHFAKQVVGGVRSPRSWQGSSPKNWFRR